MFTFVLKYCEMPLTLYENLSSEQYANAFKKIINPLIRANWQNQFDAAEDILSK